MKVIIPSLRYAARRRRLPLINQRFSRKKQASNAPIEALFRRFALPISHLPWSDPAARLRHAEQGNLGDWKTVGGNVSEMRMSIGPGYRLYFTRRGKAEIVMLIGGSKASQLRDIKLARHLAIQLGHES